MDYDRKRTTVAELVGYGSLLIPALAMYALSGIGVGLGIWYSSRGTGVAFVLLALLTLYVIHDEFFHRCFGSTKKSQAYVVGGIASYVAGAIVIALAAVGGSASAALVGTWSTTLGLAAVVAGTRYLTAERQDTTLRWLAAGFGSAFLCLVAAVIFMGRDVILALAIVIGLLAATIGIIAMRWMCRWDPKLWAAVGLAVALVGFACIGISFWMTVEPLVWLGLFLLVFALGLVPLSFAVPTLTRRWTRFGLPVAGAVGVSVGASLVVALAGELSLTALLLVLLLSALAAAAFVWEGFEMVPILILGIAITWVVADRADALPKPESVIAEQADSSDGARLTLVAIGDSYMSGEGSDRYIENTNIKNIDECRRTTTAYPQLIAAARGWDLEFYACSGAVTANVLSSGQQVEAPDSVPQIERLDSFLAPGDVDSDDISAVLVSIGGNDAWFGAIAQACVAPGNCAEHRSTVLRNVRQIGERMRTVYEEIRERVHPAPVIAMPYPLVFADETCDESPVSDEELEFLIEFTEVLNDRARTSAMQAGINFFEPGTEVFVGSRICETESLSEAVVNLSHINPQEGALADRLNPLNWLHGSAHPKPAGHRLIADQLTTWMTTIESNPEPVPAARFEIVLPSQRARVSTRMLGIPEDLACGQGQLAISGTSVGLAADEVDWTYRSAMPDSSACYTRADGTWSVGEIVADEEGTLVVPALTPDEGWAQTIVYQNVFGSWNVQILEFCEPDPNCAHDKAAVQAWTVDQSRRKIEAAAGPVFLIFIGVWTLMIASRRWWLNWDAQEQ